MDANDAPTVVILWDRSPRSRADRKCAMCGDTIAAGEKYDSTGMLVDGVFEHFVRHPNGERYPSGCPKQAVIDRAEAEAQFVADEAVWRAQ